MSKRLCKMNRKQIAANLGDIHRLVVAPKFVCRSCARSSASKDSLCKPAAIPPQKCQDKPLNEQQACGLLAEALPAQSISVTSKHITMHFCKHNTKCDQKISHNVNDYIPKASNYDFERMQKIYIIYSYSLIFCKEMS